MSHVRQQIVEAVYNLCLDLPITGNRVTMNRVYPWQVLPGIAVNQGPDETLRPASLGMREAHALSIDVVIYTKPTDATAPDSQANAICVDVEEALYADTTLGGLCRFLRLGSVAPDRSGAEERKVARYRMAWLCEYEIAAGSPETPV